MPYGLTINGIHSDTHGIMVKTVSRPSLPEYSDQYIDIPGRIGSLLVPGKPKDIPIESIGRIIHNSPEELRQKMADIAVWVYSKGKTIIKFDDQPGKYYLGKFVGKLDPKPVNEKVSEFTISFLMDPCLYSDDTITATLLPNVVNSIDNNGREDTYPLIKATFSQPSTFFGLVNGDKYIFLGEGETIDKSPVTEYERVLFDEFQAPNGWQPGTVIEDGAVTGSFAYLDNWIYAGEYGVGSRWHGPAQKKAFAGNVLLQDFKAEAFFELISSDSSQIGRMEVSFLDVNGNVVAKVMVGDYHTATELTYGSARLGPATDPLLMFDSYGTKKGDLNRCRMTIAIARRGKIWTAWLGKLDEKFNATTKAQKILIDKNNKYAAQISQVQISIASFSTYPAPQHMLLHKLIVYKINGYSPAIQVPHIVEAGDTIEIDCNTASVRKNGLPFLSVWDPSGDFFPLAPGENLLTYSPSTATVTVTRQERG